MNQPTTMQKLGATPAKLALVGVLGIVFLIVVVPQLIGQSPEPTRASASSKQKARRTRPKQSKKETKKPLVDTTAEARPAQVWPDIPFQQIVTIDPLAKPEWFLAILETEKKEQQLADSNENSQALAELEKQGASIVVITNRERAATIGEQLVRIGDRIEGFEVSDITTEGVVLTEVRSN